MGRPKIFSQEDKSWIEKHVESQTLVDMSHYIGCDSETISRYLKNNGIELKPRCNIWTKEKAQDFISLYEDHSLSVKEIGRRYNIGSRSVIETVKVLSKKFDIQFTKRPLGRMRSRHKQAAVHGCTTHQYPC